MLVKATPGLKVPKEQKPREYITEDKSEEIEVTAYYLRRLADAELVEVVVEQPNPTDKAHGAKASAKAAS